MTVDLYVMPNCGGCIATKRALEKREIGYVDRPIEDLPETARAQVSSAPVVITSDGQIWGGFRPDRINALVA